MPVDRPYLLLPGGEPWPPWLEEWVGRVVADLQGESPIEFRLGLLTHVGDHGLWHLDRDLRFGAVVFGEDDFLSTRDGGSDFHRWLLADRLQEQFFESEEAFGEARPACPGHPHPADVTEDGLWVCPRTRTTLGRVGELTARHGP